MVPPAARLGAVWRTSRAPNAAKKPIAPHQRAAAKRKRALRRVSSVLAHPLGGHGRGEEARFESAAEEKTPRLAPALSVRARPVVHVHADEPVRLLSREAAREAHRVGEGLFAVRERVDDGAREAARHAGDRLLSDVLPHHVPAEREGKAGVGLPERAEIGEEPEPLLLPRELSLLDEEARVDLAPGDQLSGPVERHT